MAIFGSQADYYSSHAALYSDPEIRPRYPPELFEAIFSFSGSSTDTALDVATGSGQSARQLATRYKQVLAGLLASAFLYPTYLDLFIDLKQQF